jgi:hypothetical protein
MGLVLPKGRLLKRRLSGSVIQFWLRPVWSPRRPIYAALRYQLVALATYLPKGHLTKPRFLLRSGSQTQLSKRSRRLTPEFESE